MTVIAMRTNEQVMEDALYAELRSLLELCTEQQAAFLWSIYINAKPRPKFPLGVGEIGTVLSLVRRTVRVNAAIIGGGK